MVFSVLPSTSDSLSDIFKIFLLNTLYIYLLNLQFLVKQELPTLPEHLSLSPVLVGFVLLDRLFYMYVLLIVVCPFVLFIWPLCCLFLFDIRILIVPLVSSNSSSKQYYLIKLWSISLIHS